jgi:cardiolipin synthase
MTQKKRKTKQQRRKEIVQKVKTTAQVVRKGINIPNLLTMGRIWAIPAIVFTMFLDKIAENADKPTWAWIGVGLFAAAGITDYMDGYLARHLNQLSRFGRVLDPIADKLLVGSILIMLAWQGKLDSIMVVPAVIILCREILVSGLREFLAEIQVGCPVTKLAKWKTACQMVALPVLMVAKANYSGFFSGFLTWVGWIALWGAAILTVKTGYDYWKSGRKYMDE